MEGRSSIALQRLLLVAVLLSAWEAAVRFGSASPLLVSPPSAVAVAALKIILGRGTAPDFYYHLRVTIFEVAASFSITAALGLFIGFVIGSSRLMGDAFEPVLLALFAIPNVIIFPIIFLLFGFGSLPNIGFGVVVGVFSVVFNTAAGVRQVDRNFITLARSTGLGKGATFFKVVLPAAAPSILSGLRLGFGFSLIGVVVAELLVNRAGLGLLIDWTAYQYVTAEHYALIIITMAIGVVGNSVFSTVERAWAQ